MTATPAWKVLWTRADDKTEKAAVDRLLSKKPFDETHSASSKLDPREIDTIQEDSGHSSKMKSTVLLVAALVAASDALPDIIPTRLYHKASNVVARYTKGTQLPITPATLKSQTSQGCFNSSGSLVFDSTPDWNSIGGCAKDICSVKGYAVGATTGGNQCWCGNEYPPKADLVDDKNCDVGCTGYPQEACESCWACRIPAAEQQN